MKKQFETRFLFFVTLIGFASVFVFLFATVAYVGVSRAVSEVTKSRYHDYEELFVGTVTPDLLLGKESDVFQKCFEQKERPEVSRIRIAMASGEEVCSFGSESRSSFSFKQTVFFDTAQEKPLAVIEMGFRDNSSKILRASLLENFAVILVVILVFALLVTQFLLRPYIETLSQIASRLQVSDLNRFEFTTENFPALRSLEMNLLIKKLALMSASLKNSREVEIEFERQRTLSELAAQVSHDIRSPLTALNLAVRELATRPNEMQAIIQSATTRISEIANALLERGKKQITTQSEITPIPMAIAPALAELVDEKRVEFSAQPELRLKFDADPAQVFFADLPLAELKQTVSNLVNNSREAISATGQITVSLRAQKTLISVSISDDGCGIPPEILERLLAGERGVTYGKEGIHSGSGLGVYQAKAFVERCKGRLEVFTRSGMGTIMTLHFPRAEKPAWLATEIPLLTANRIILIDDDPAIHEVWKTRFAATAALLPSTVITDFYSIDEFEASAAKQATGGSTIYLVDFELSSKTMTGLSLIEKYGLAEKAVLVTGRADTTTLQQRCLTLGLRMLPKEAINDVSFT